MWSWDWTFYQASANSLSLGYGTDNWTTLTEAMKFDFWWTVNINSLAWTWNAQVCVGATGNLYRGTPGC